MACKEEVTLGCQPSAVPSPLWGRLADRLWPVDGSSGTMSTGVELTAGVLASPQCKAAHLAKIEGHPLIVCELGLHVHCLRRGRVEECCRGLHRCNDVVHNLQWASAVRRTACSQLECYTWGSVEQVRAMWAAAGDD